MAKQREPEPEPDDDELIAYLDGELDPDEATELESKLAKDPKARARASEYKKTYDLLDYLPKSEPSAEFASRTLTKIQPVLLGGSSEQSFTLSPSVSAMQAMPRRRWPELVAWLLIIVVAGGVGYAAHLVAKPYLDSANRESFDQADLPLIHEMPWFLGVDDLEFVRKLREADLFEEDSPSDTPRPGSAETAKISLDEQQKLIELFLSFPKARQQQLRTLYKQLKDLPAKERDALHATLMSYAVWLERLPDADRKQVLAATNGEERLKVIQQIHERHWRESLPQNQKALLARTASAEETIRLANELREREISRKQEWELAKRQWQPNKDGQPKPWPFNDPVLPKQLEAFAKNVLGADLQATIDKKLELGLPAACRLTREEFAELKIKYDAAQKEGYWGVYAECLYRLAERHPSLPKPGKSEPIVRLNQLPVGYQRFLPKDGTGKKTRFDLTAGKWPDFALSVQEGAKPAKGVELLPALGPAKLAEFPDDVQAVLKPMLAKVAKKEIEQLTAVEGKWPEYPRAMMELAKSKNVVVPGVSLPGDPELWAKYYKRVPVKK